MENSIYETLLCDVVFWHQNKVTHIHTCIFICSYLALSIPCVHSNFLSKPKGGQNRNIHTNVECLHAQQNPEATAMSVIQWIPVFSSPPVNEEHSEKPITKGSPSQRMKDCTQAISFQI